MGDSAAALGFPIGEGEISILGRAGTPVRASVRRLGSGRQLCFLHGLIGVNEHWIESAEALTDCAECVLLQLPLLGLRGADCSVEGVVALTANFLRERLDGPSVLVGSSFGGHVAARLAIEAPELVSGLVLAGSSGVMERDLLRKQEVRRTREWLAEKLGELFYDSRLASAEDIDRAERELSNRAGIRAMLKLSRSALTDQLGDRLGDVRCPSLLIWGRHDIVTPPEAAERFHRSLADSRLVWLDECGHAPMLEKPREFAAALRDFVTELD